MTLLDLCGKVVGGGEVGGGEVAVGGDAGKDEDGCRR